VINAKAFEANIDNAITPIVKDLVVFMLKTNDPLQLLATTLA